MICDNNIIYDIVTMVTTVASMYYAISAITNQFLLLLLLLPPHQPVPLGFKSTIQREKGRNDDDNKTKSLHENLVD